MRPTSNGWFALLALLISCPAIGWGQLENGITVAGVGQVDARPNVLELDVRVAGSAEMTADAVVKFRDAKQRTRDAYEALRLDNLEIVERGISISGGDNRQKAQMMMRGMPAQDVKNNIELARTLTLRLKGIENLEEEELMDLVGKLLDVGRDVGASVGISAEELVRLQYSGRQPPEAGVVRFVLEDHEALLAKAYALAMEDARARANRLAELAGARVGAVLAASETSVPTANNEGNRLHRDTFDLLRIRIDVRVRFALEPAGGGVTSP